jgi:Glycosyltransferase Family 4
VSNSGATPKVLAVSFHFPPANNPRAIQVARLLRHVELPTVLVCADHSDKNDRRDAEAAHGAEASLNSVIRVPFVSSATGRRASQLAGRVLHPFWELLPDQSRGWKRPVIDSLAQKITDWSQTTLVTFGSPMSDHLIGLELKRQFKIPWLAHFSDPWVDNPFNNYDWFTRRTNLDFERQVMEKADRLLFTSQETVDLVMAKYDRSWRAKARIIPHCYDPSQYPSNSTSNGRTLVIRFLGDMYGPRTPRPLFAALSRALSKNPSILDDVCFEFVGSMCDLDLNAMGLPDLPHGLVKLTDTVSNKESLNLMTSADGLMVIDAPAKLSVFLPSKLIDYIGAGKPLLGITPPGTASNLIAELGGWTGDPSQPEEIDRTLDNFLGFLRDRKTASQSFWGTETVRNRFVAKVVADHFQTLVRELI